MDRPWRLRIERHRRELQAVSAIDSGRLGGTTASLISSYRVLVDRTRRQRATWVGRQLLQQLDGADRTNRIRYDTPTFFGFKAGVDFIDKHNFDAALHYSGMIAGTKVKGAFGFCHTRGSQSAGGGACFGNG